MKSPQGQKRTRCMSDVPGIKPGKKRPREDINRKQSNLFKSKNKTDELVELLIFIAPRVIE